MRNLYNQWMDEGIKEYTKAGKMKRPSYLLVATWVKEAWEAVDINMIRKSFKCCGISNTMDGTEDDLILDFTRLTARTNSGRGIEERNDDENNSDYENNGDSENDDNGENDCEYNGEYVDGEDVNENESGIVYDGFYEESEELTTIQDWN